MQQYELVIRFKSNGRFFPKASRLALGPTQPPIQRVLSAISPKVKRLGREDGHSHQFSFDVEN
jgi:hypothetical protein